MRTFLAIVILWALPAAGWGQHRGMGARGGFGHGGFAGGRGLSGGFGHGGFRGGCGSAGGSFRGGGFGWGGYRSGFGGFSGHQNPFGNVVFPGGTSLFGRRSFFAFGGIYAPILPYPLYSGYYDAPAYHMRMRPLQR